MADETQAQLPPELSREERLEQVLAEYLRKMEQTGDVDQQALLDAHPDLADDLREFFANHDQMQRLAAPLIESVPPHEQSTILRSETAQVGLCIGPYTLVQKLGEGGMGEVWVAKQSVPVKRKVALKLIRHGSHSKEVLARFEHERQALAMMDHPNIAKVFDGGATLSGQPYFVMELVNGLPLTRYCDEARLTPRERMQLFVPICQAVQHAHQKGIVHRDLKPSNILVTIYDGQPVPKVIDFGVAKATGGKLTDESMFTQFGAVVGTLEYMSPEQTGFNGQDVDTRADIYSLGVILYELLTGLRPMDGLRLRKAALTEMIRIIQEDEPSKPSTRLSSDASLPSLAALRQIEPKRLTALLRGELDWVVMKCLEKSRDRRYETANGLARDIQHYLADEPVEARPPSVGYRLSKFLHRHKGPVLAASLVLSTLIAGIIGTSWGMMREFQQRQIAETNESKANTTAIKERQERSRADDNFKLARRHLNIAHMNLAQVAWEDARVGETIRLLELYRPVSGNAGSLDDLRGFEWHFWNRLAHSYQMSLQGHTGYVLGVVFSKDGKRLASASDDQTVKVWDATSGQQVLTLRGHTSRVNSVSFSPDGKRLASASGSIGQLGELKIWDATNGQATLELKGHTSPVNSVVFSPAGSRLASGSGDIGQPGELIVWDAASAQPTFILKGLTSPINSVAFSPDGKRLASASDDDTLTVWDAVSGQKTLTLRGHSGPVNSVSFSPDGERLTSASLDGTVKVWDSTGGEQKLSLHGHLSAITSVAFSVDGKKLASASRDQTVKLWDAANGQEIRTLKGHTDEVMCVAFSPDGKRLASASFDQTVKVWDTTTGQETLTLNGHTGIVSSVAFSADGKRLASASDDHSGGDDHSAKVWNATSGQQTLALKGHTDYVTSVAFSPDGTRLASASRDRTVKLWNATNGHETLTLKGHTDEVMCVAFSPDGKRLASVSRDYLVKLWDISSRQGTLTLKGHTDEVMCVAFSPDGKRLASASRDRTVKVWDATSGQEALTLRAHNGGVTSLAFSPDGKRLASAGQGRRVDVWDARPWTPELRAEQQALCLIRFLRAKPLAKPALFDAIAADATISEPARQRALELARDWQK